MMNYIISKIKPSVVSKISTNDNWEELKGKKITIKKGLEISHIYNKCIFANENISGIQCVGILFQDCSFENIELSYSTVTLCSFNNSTFKNCKIHEVDFLNAGFNSTILENVTFTSTSLNNSRFLGMQPKKLLFEDCDIYQSIFLKSILTSKELRFIDCNQEEAYFVENKYY